MTEWQYSGSVIQPKAIFRILDNGKMESCLDDRADVLLWIAEGNMVLPAEDL